MVEVEGEDTALAGWRLYVALHGVASGWIAGSVQTIADPELISFGDLDHARLVMADTAELLEDYDSSLTAEIRRVVHGDADLSALLMCLGRLEAVLGVALPLPAASPSGEP